MTSAGRVAVPHLVSERAARPVFRRRPTQAGLAALLSLLATGIAPARAAAAPPPGCERPPAVQESQPSLEAVLTDAERLLACSAPQAALAVLARLSPGPGEGRRRWLVMQWRAAQAGLNHALAVQALTLLAEGDLRRLEDVALPLVRPGASDTGRASGGKPSTRSALDLLAEHLESLGQRQQAARVLLLSSTPGALTAARWGRAAALAEAMPLQQRDQILEQALEQAAAAGAWGLVAALLDQQLAAGVSDPASSRALERRLRLGERIDDAYGEWLQRRQLSGPDHEARNRELELLLRSPRLPGGHAGPAQLPDSPLSSPVQP
ncbi:hypothetical protein [Cyanobium sp. CH-040]|uniref:hypothetical protein n=1 Tax=Cyanobium sp. CH-040 TaxID=2823708 RepID=UPI0020CE1A51|nr:hypothetical protein [Cyanobium sp. CH-040]MCP9928939.1 hypothetical protein [Cyanobium sp. CH-040]